ncbi:MAG TPA: NAD(P)/FAD-dependent oxidoreductase [Actinomycetota bacterium]|nr:NAD(P)/FAD-dependent oxidoreductase [Actinomycetota bacterium]
MYDVVIVGGRCAGAPLGMLLAQAGHSVLIVDRATFPSDTLSTHFIQLPGMARLARWGLMDALFETNCPPITAAYFDAGGSELEVEIPMHQPVHGLACPRRTVLDKMLVDAAVTAGAELAEGVLVDSLVRDAERVVGISGHTTDGSFEARGRIVVGADGRHSLVAREAEAPYIEYEEPISGGWYSYFRGTGLTTTDVFFHDELVSVMFPTNDELACVAIAWPKSQFAEKRRDIEGSFNGALMRFGERGRRILDAEREERFAGAADLSNFIRKAHGPGWALAGDARYHKDPVPADGISDAFRDAEFLSDAISAFLTDEKEEGAALRDYETRTGVFSQSHLEPALRCAGFGLSPQERLSAFIDIRVLDSQEVETPTNA